MSFPGCVPIAILGIACAVSGCGTRTATCPVQPSVRPSRNLKADHYGTLDTSIPGNAFVLGSAVTRPSFLRFADGVSVTVDNRTRVLSGCNGPICSAYIAYRPHTHTADWVFGIAHAPGSPAEIGDAAIWEVGYSYVVMSNGLRLSVAQTVALPTLAQLLTWGGSVSVTLNAKGAIQAIIHGGCA